jgi:glycosyltransferase involved in cell wall biosynthesis
MKVALIGRYGEGDIVAGPERVARELYSELKKNNLQVVFIEYFFSGYKNSSLYKKIFGREVPNNNSILRLGIIPLLVMLFKERFEIIHIANSQRFILFLFLIKPFIKSKLIATHHGLLKYEVPKKNFWFKRYFIDLWVERLIVKKSKLLIFPSNLLFETFKRYYKIPEGRCKIIPNGISNIFHKHNISFPSIENSMKIVFYNAFSDSINKGLDELIELLRDVKNKIELYVIGKKTEVNSYVNIEIIYVEPKAHKELIYFLRDKHFIIKSPAFEPFSIIVAECMLLGVIPIVNDNVGMRDFIEHEVNGFIYDSSSSNELVKLLNVIYEDKYDLNLISANAKKIYDVLNWENITEQYIATYQSIL